MSHWKNRIIGYGEEKPDQLLANPKNVRIHPKHQQGALAGVLREVGVVQNIIVNQRSGCLVDGHLRVSLALRDGQASVPVTYVDLDEAEEALVLATLDPIGALAGTDAAKLDALLREVSTGEAAVQELLGTLAQKSGIAPVVDMPDEQLNPHRSEEDYLASSIRKIELLLDVEEYDEILQIVHAVRRAQKLDDNTEAICFVLRNYADTSRESPAA